MDALTVPQPQWRLLYDNKDITAELAPLVLEITYSDKLEGESDELEVNIIDGLHRFKDSWFPTRGARLKLYIGYAGTELTEIGWFEIDEIEFTGPPDKVRLRCLAAGVKEALRTDNTKAYEDKTLREIAQEVADRHKLTLIGDAPGRTYKRVTQHEETDLAFLNRLGEDDGIAFTIKNGKLVWHDKDLLDEAKTVLTLQRTGRPDPASNLFTMETFSFSANTATTYSECTVSYHDPVSKELLSHTEKDPDAKSGDSLKLTERCEDLEQAKGKAQAALKAANIRKIDGRVTITGTPGLRSGINVEVQGLYKLDGRYQIKSACHKLDRSRGYSTEAELSALDGDEP